MRAGDVGDESARRNKRHIQTRQAHTNLIPGVVHSGGIAPGAAVAWEALPHYSQRQLDVVFLADRLPRRGLSHLGGILRRLRHDAVECALAMPPNQIADLWVRRQSVPSIPQNSMLFLAQLLNRTSLREVDAPLL